VHWCRLNKFTQASADVNENIESSDIIQEKCVGVLIIDAEKVNTRVKNLRYNKMKFY